MGRGLGLTARLVAAPVTEALAVVASLHAARGKMEDAKDTVVLPNNAEVLPAKLALFNLQKFIKEDDFAVEFMLKGGVKILVDLIEKDDKTGLTGNSLAVSFSF